MSSRFYIFEIDKIKVLSSSFCEINRICFFSTCKCINLWHNKRITCICVCIIVSWDLYIARGVIVKITHWVDDSLGFARGGAVCVSLLHNKLLVCRFEKSKSILLSYIYIIRAAIHAAFRAIYARRAINLSRSFFTKTKKNVQIRNKSGKNNCIFLFTEQFLFFYFFRNNEFK